VFLDLLGGLPFYLEVELHLVGFSLRAMQFAITGHKVATLAHSRSTDAPSTIHSLNRTGEKVMVQEQQFSSLGAEMTLTILCLHRGSRLM
jgi:hypothetical protein